MCLKKEYIYVYIHNSSRNFLTETTLLIKPLYQTIIHNFIFNIVHVFPDILKKEITSSLSLYNLARHMKRVHCTSNTY